MKFIGQYIQDFIARFRNDVYLEEDIYLEGLENTSAASYDDLIGVDVNNKIIRAALDPGVVTVTAGNGIDVSGTSTGVEGTVYGNVTVTAETATDSNPGVVELATTDETTTGIDANKAVTPDGLKDGYQGSTNVTTLGTISTGTWNGTAVAKVRQFTHHMFTDDIGQDNKVYIGLQESDAENTTATNKNLPFLVPSAGKLIKVLMRANSDLSSKSYTWTLETVNTSSNTASSPSVIGTAVGAGPTGQTMATYNFDGGLDGAGESGTNAVSLGDTVQLGISCNDTSGTVKYYVTCVWEFDLS